MSGDESFDSSATAVRALTENASRLGLTWSLRPATVFDFDFASQKGSAVYDGDTEAISFTSLCGGMLPGFRVMGMSVPPSANYALSYMNVPQPGTLVARLQASTAQSIPDAGSGTFIQFDTQLHNWFQAGFSTGDPTKFTPPVAGFYNFVGRAVFAGNPTSRRAAFINTNGSTGAPGTLGGQSLQSPATGSCQIQGTGAGFFNGTTDYAGLRVIQNSGAPLSTLSSATDGGCMLEIYYVGPFLAQPA